MQQHETVNRLIGSSILMTKASGVPGGFFASHVQNSSFSR